MPVSFTRTFFLVFLLAGWVLSADAQAVETYRVKKSDTMQTIADRFGLSVEVCWNTTKRTKPASSVRATS